jgi:EmrB/QacA subfamily drug resistance transporter
MKKIGPLTEAHLLIVISVAFSSFMSGLNYYVVSISLPTIANQFNAGTGEVSPVILAYMLVSTSSLFVFGRLADRIGLKKVFVAGYVIFTVSSLFCGLSTSVRMLVGFRLVQGIGGGMLMASGYAVIARFLPGDITGRAYGITLTSFAVGIATGAPVGGFVTGYLSWHWIFFVNVPVGVVAIIFALRSVPGRSDYRQREDKEREAFDIPGALLSFFGLGMLLYGCNMGNTIGWTSWRIVISLSAALVLLVLFVLREKRCKFPLLDFALLKKRSLAYALSASILAFILLGGNTFLLPFYLQMAKHLSVQQTGLMLLIYSLVQILVTPYAGRLSDKVNPHMLCSAGLASAFFCVLFFSSSLRFDSLAPSFVLLVWLPLSYAFFIAPNTNRIMHLASSGRHGTASGLLSTATNLGMMLGVVVFDTVFSQSIAGALPPGVSLLRASIPENLFLRGFSHAYLVGALVCFAACLFSFAGRSRAVRQSDQRP